MLHRSRQCTERLFLAALLLLTGGPRSNPLPRPQRLAITKKLRLLPRKTLGFPNSSEVAAVVAERSACISQAHVSAPRLLYIRRDEAQTTHIRREAEERDPYEYYTVRSAHPLVSRSRTYECQGYSRGTSEYRYRFDIDRLKYNTFK